MQFANCTALAALFTTISKYETLFFAEAGIVLNFFLNFEQN